VAIGEYLFPPDALANLQALDFVYVVDFEASCSCQVVA
jgi:hypothetical protein